LPFFLHEESPSTKDSLERAAELYQQSSCGTSVKQAVEKIFELENLYKGSPVNHVFSKISKGSLHVNYALLSEESVQTALNKIFCMAFATHILFVDG